MNSLRQSLIALKCPFSQDFNPDDRKHCVILVRWLEDRKIREYDINDRKQFDDSPEWENMLSNYICKLNCPMQPTDCILDKLLWLISYALQLDYEDTVISSQYVYSKSIISLYKSNIGGIHINISNIQEMIGLFRILNEPTYDLLRRIYHGLKFQVSGDAVASRNRDFCEFQSENKLSEHFPLGFDTKDKTVNQLALVIKMLYLSDFRDLQNEVNSLLVLVQEFTANPRLSASLGRIGT